jgi:hypothetical protein
MRRSLIALLAIVFVAIVVLLWWNMQKKELIRVNIDLSGTPCGTLEIYTDYSYLINCQDPALKKQLGQALDQVIAEDNALLRYEEMENGMLVMKGEYLTRQDKNFVHALLSAAADRVNSRIKDGFLSFQTKY